MPSDKSTHFHAQDIPNLSGYVAIITGGNSGIGYETTLQLALHGARVYIAGRSPNRVEKAMEQMKASNAIPLDLHMLEMDMQSLRSVKEGAEAFMRQESRLDLLINNAGIMAVPYKLTADGFETQWQTNHLAPFLLVKTLLPILESTAASSSSEHRVRIINVSSDAALLPPSPKQLDLARPNLEYVTGAMNEWKRYSHSKIASIIHARALHKRLRTKGISAYSVHPGIVATNLQTAATGLFSIFVRHMIRCSEKIYSGGAKLFSPVIIIINIYVSSKIRLVFHPCTNNEQKQLTQEPASRGLLPGMISVVDGATSTLFCATSEKAVVNSGSYFAPFGKLDKRPDRWNEDEGLVEKLWVESERMVKGAGF